MCTYDSRIPDVVESDPLRLRQVLVNLLGNAVKFTAPGGGVVLQVRLDKKESDLCHISFVITDTGIGIPRDKQEKVFDGFTQADSSITREFGGTG